MKTHHYVILAVVALVGWAAYRHFVQKKKLIPTAAQISAAI